MTPERTFDLIISEAGEARHSPNGLRLL